MKKSTLGIAVSLTALCCGLGAYLFTERCETKYGAYNRLKSKICYNRLTGKVSKEQFFKYIEPADRYEIKENIYDKNGNLSMYTLYNRWGEDITDIKERLIRDKNGKLKRKIVETRVFGSSDIKYDDEGKVLSKEFFGENDDGSRRVEKSYIYNYEKQGENFLAKIYLNGELAQERIYDKSGRLLASSNHEEHGSDIKCEYDERGNLLAEYRDGNIYQEYAYNDDNAVIMEREYEKGKIKEERQYDGSKTAQSERLVNPYYDFCQTYGDEIISGGKMTAYITYDADGNRTVKEYLYEKGKAVLLTNGKVTEEAFYNDNGDVVLRVRPDYKAEYEYYPNHDLKKVIENGRVVKEYNEQGKWLVNQRYDGLYRYKYNEQGQLAEVERDGEVIEQYDAAGRKIMEINHHGRQEWEYDSKGRLIRQLVTESDYVADIKYDSKGRKTSIIRNGREIKYTYNKDGYIATLDGVIIEQAFTEKDNNGVVWDVVVKGGKKVGKSGKNHYEITEKLPDRDEIWWFYDEENKITTKESRDYYKGELQHRRVWRPKADNPEIEEEISYDYADGRLMSETHYEGSNKIKDISYDILTGKIQNEDIYEYKQNKEKKEVYKNGKLEEKTLFDQDGRQILYVLYDVQTGAEKRVIKDTYDSEGRPLASYENDKLVNKYIYDNSGHRIEKRYRLPHFEKIIYETKEGYTYEIFRLECENGKKISEKKIHLNKVRLKQLL